MNKKRLLLVYFLFLCTVVFLSARFYIIANHGSRADHVLAGQYSRRIDIASRKGFVFDRNGKYIDVVEDGYITLVNPTNLTSVECYELSEVLAEYGDRQQSYYHELLIARKPFTISTDSDVTDDHCKSFVKYKQADNILCHLLGYRNVNEDGVTGVMQAYDSFLSDYSSGKVYACYRSDAKGKMAEGTELEIFDIRYSAANGLYLTIDSDIQREVERICSEHLDMGAVVVQDTNTGEIYAMVSAPVYDKEKLPEYLNSDRGELLNRCLLGYTPGSLFKTVVSVAALLDSEFDPEAEYECKGYIEVDGVRIKCHNLYGHGKLDLKGAFAQSCNPYFINLGTRLGVSKIVETAQSLGIGCYDVVNLIKCSKGCFPKTDDLSASANFSVGQGELLITPLQVCSMMSTAATGSYRKPSVVLKTVLDKDTSEYVSTEQIKVLDDEIVRFVRDLLVSCVKEGTGYRANSDIVETAGKTATAQSGQLKDGNEVIHSWFAGVFPSDSPRFTVCVLCDGNGIGNTHPSVIFRLIAERIIQIEKTDQIINKMK